MKEANKKTNLDDIKINMKQDHEVQYWTRKWGITTLQLETAVKAAGSSVVKHVEEHLRQNGEIIKLSHGIRIDYKMLMNMLPSLFKKNHVLLTFIFLVTSISGSSQGKFVRQYDTTYYESFQDYIIARIFISQKYTSTELRKGNDAPRLRYKPNSNLNMGVGATYHNLTLNLSYGFGFLNNDKAKGETKKLDLQTRLYGRKWAIDLYGQFYHDYYEYPKGRGSADNTSYYLRPDLKLSLIGVSAYRIFNYRRFTLHPAFAQDEYQKKSAGSFMAGAQIYYGSVKGDSSLVPSQLASFYDRKGIAAVRILEIGPGIGYAYTQVFPYHLYLTGTYTINVNVGLVKETGATGSNDHISANVNMLYRLGGGYNNGDYNLNAFWVNTRLAAKGALSGNNYLMNSGNYRFVFSKRLQPGRRLKKRLRQLDRILPIN